MPERDELTVEITIRRGDQVLWRVAQPAFLESAGQSLHFIEREPTLVFGSQSPYILEGFHFKPVVVEIKLESFRGESKE